MLKFVCLVRINITICKYLAYGTCKHFVVILAAACMFGIVDRGICEVEEHTEVGTGDKVVVSVLISKKSCQLRKQS